MSHLSALHDVAVRLTGDGRGILAADESIRTMSQRLVAQGIDGTERNRRDYRELLVTAPAVSDHVSGVILCDETFGQDLHDGRPFPVACRELGILPGIKVDTGTTPLPRQGGALITEGLDGLGARLAAYAAAGAAFAKWRAVLDPATSTTYAVAANASALARYAALCQEHGIVPIVEPEVLATGGHGLERSRELARSALAALFDELAGAGVDLAGVVLKPSFVTPGLDQEPAPAQQVAEATYGVLAEVVPAQVPGIAFLSGGHPTARSCAYLAALNEIPGLPWRLTFSFGRALVSPALEAWAGRPEQIAAAQSVLLSTCAAAGAATLQRVA